MTLTTSTPQLAPEREQDFPLVDALIARAFGPGRFVKTAERLREGNHPLLDLSFVAWRDGCAVGCVRLWPIRIGEAPALPLGFARAQAVTMPGPVDPRRVLLRRLNDGSDAPPTGLVSVPD
jgi:predicted N-acetyltransferase YhbS